MIKGVLQDKFLQNKIYISSIFMGESAIKRQIAACLRQSFSYSNRAFCYATSIYIKRFFLFVAILIVFGALLVKAQTGEARNQEQLSAENIITEVHLLLKQGKANEATTILQTAAANYPNNSRLSFLLGKALYLQGKYKGAIEQLNFAKSKIEIKSGEYLETIQMLGLSHYVLGHLAESIPYLEKVSTSSPENNEIAYALGVALIQTRQPAKSRDVFAKLFRVPTNSAAAYLLNAKMHVRQQFEETAEVELKKALKIDAKLPEVRFVLGELAIYRAEIDKGIKLLKQEITLNPAGGMAYYRLGEALSRQLKWDEAIPPLQKSIWLNPFFSGPYIVLGKVYLKKQDLENAENLLRHSTTLDPKNFGAHYLLAQVLQQAGKTEEAKAAFALAEKLRGKNEKEP